MSTIHLRTPPFEWTCDRCRRSSTVDAEHYHSGFRRLSVTETKVGETALVFTAISCPNADCRELTLAIRLAQYKPSLGHAYPVGTVGDPIEEWSLLPARAGKSE